MSLKVLAIGAALFLTACQPSDVKVKSVKERLDAGQLVEFTKPGYRRPSCSQAAPDWTNLSLSDNAERERIVLKAQGATLNPGRHSCFRVGGIVNLAVEGKSNGRARIRKLGIIKIANLESRQLKGKFFAKSDDFNRFKNNVLEKRMKPEHEGLVTIIEVDYLPGSAADQKLIEDKEREKNSGDGFEETTADGQRVGECRNNSVWKEILVPADHQSLVMGGQIKSWYRLGNFNCLTQGQDVDVKASLSSDTPSAGKVKITRVKMFKINALSRERFDLPDYDFETLKAKILTENADKKPRPEEWIIVYDLQGPGSVAKPVDCRPDTITAMTGADVNAKRFTTVLPKSTCLKVGHLVMLHVPLNENNVAEIPAKVVAVEEKAEGVFITVDRIGGGQP